MPGSRPGSDPDSGARARFVDHVVEMLGPLGTTARRMFGGYGIFHDGLMVALVADDRLYFKAEAASRATFADAGGEPFTYERRGKPASLNYWSVPDDALEDPQALRGWAEHGIAIARRAAAAKRAKSGGKGRSGRDRP